MLHLKKKFGGGEVGGRGVVWRWMGGVNSFSSLVFLSSFLFLSYFNLQRTSYVIKHFSRKVEGGTI